MHYSDKLINNNTNVEVTFGATYGFSDKELFSIHTFLKNKRVIKLLLTDKFVIDTFAEQLMGEDVMSEDHSFIITFKYKNVEEILILLKEYCGNYYMTEYYWDLKNVLNRFKETISPSKEKIKEVDIDEDIIPF